MSESRPDDVVDVAKHHLYNETISSKRFKTLFASVPAPAIALEVDSTSCYDVTSSYISAIGRRTT